MSFPDSLDRSRYREVDHKRMGKESGMAEVFTLQVLVFMLAASSLVAAGNGWCSGRYSSSCEANQVCCHHQCVTGSDCYHLYCQTDLDCSSGESCCNSQCETGYDCSGFSCSSDSHCSDYEVCCYGICQNANEYCDDYQYDPTPEIIGSVCGSLILICLISMCIFFARRRRQAIVRPGRVIVGRRVTSVTTSRGVPQAHPPYTGQVPAPYQQGYSYYPPPQYQQHQTAAPPPYNAGVTSPSQPPPPYNPVYAPQTTYGAVQNDPSGPV